MVFVLGSIAASRGYRVFSYDEVGSTSTEAARAATSGDVGDVWFASLKQTAGRGRRGRAWETPSGNLAASLLLVPDCDPSIAATLGFVAGVALNRALVTALPTGTVKQGIDGADDGVDCLRACFVNFRTTDDDVRETVRVVRDVAARLPPAC